jgi:hypothetical protein
MKNGNREYAVDTTQIFQALKSHMQGETNDDAPNLRTLFFIPFGNTIPISIS